MTSAASRLGVAAMAAQPSMPAPGGAKALAGDQFGLVVQALEEGTGVELDRGCEDNCLLASPAEADEAVRIGDEPAAASIANLLRRALSGGASSQSSTNSASAGTQLRIPGEQEPGAGIDKDTEPVLSAPRPAKLPAGSPIADHAVPAQPADILVSDHEISGFGTPAPERSAPPLMKTASDPATQLIAVVESLPVLSSEVSRDSEPVPLLSAKQPKTQASDAPRQSKAQLLTVLEEDGSVAPSADLEVTADAGDITDQDKAPAEQQRAGSVPSVTGIPVAYASGAFPAAMPPPLVPPSEGDGEAAPWPPVTDGRADPSDQRHSGPVLDRPAGSNGRAQGTPAPNQGRAAPLAHSLERLESSLPLPGAKPFVAAVTLVESSTASGRLRLETGTPPALLTQQSQAAVQGADDTESPQRSSTTSALAAAARPPLIPAASVLSIESSPVETPVSTQLTGSGRASQDPNAPDLVSSGPAAAPQPLALFSPATQIIQKMADELGRPEAGAAVGRITLGDGGPAVTGEKITAFRIRLQPESLGDVDVFLRRGPADVSVRIAVSSEAAAQLLQGDLRLLQDRLGLLLPGERLAELNITVRDQPAPAQGQAPAFTGSGSANTSAGGFEQGQQRRSRAESGEPAIPSGRPGGNEEVDVVRRRHTGLVV